MSLLLVAALSWASLLWWVDVILKVAIALGAVIFVHELGHFLVAKACGVKIEKFMIGFDIGGYKLSWRRGETLYGIGILPLGGYVKMFGQDDDPSHIAEQMEKSQISAASENAVPITGPNGETYYVDRHSYLAKSVPQRMAIISAGVVMNIIFAFIFAVIAFGLGVPYTPSIVSQTVPGSPAWQAGFEPGDEIVQLGSRKNPTFLQLSSGIVLGDLEQGIPMLVRRASDGKEINITLKPTQAAGEMARVGIVPPMTVRLSKSMPTAKGSAAASAKLIQPAVDTIEGDPKLQSGDVLVRVGNTPVNDYRDLSAQLAQNPDKPLLITVERAGKKHLDDPESGAAITADESQELVFEVPRQPLRQLGLVMEMGPITALQVDSPAIAAGFKKGDVIELVDGRPIADSIHDQDGWTPTTLPFYLQQAARDSREVEFTVRRQAGEQSAAEQLVLRVTPVLPTAIHSDVPPGAPIVADAIGIAYRVESRVHAVEADGPASAASIAPGDMIVGASVHLPKDDNGKLPKPVPVEFEADRASWPALEDAVQFAPEGTKVELVVQRGDAEPRKEMITPQTTEGVFIATRGFIFEPLIRTHKAATIGQQVRLGFNETIDSLTLVYRFLRKLGTQQVPITMLGGPGTIAVAAGASASQGLSSLLIFLTMLSANLAVLNFLPIPLLDGGHMVFLAYEGIRGRPASERFVLALHMAGFVFIISLMVFVIGLDIHRWILSD